VTWAHNKRLQDEQELASTEATLLDLYALEGGGYLTQESKEELFSLEKKKRTLLEAKEEVWCQKIKLPSWQVGMKIPNSSRHTQRDGKLPTQSGV
jgi:hypothetical protein